MGIEQGGTPHDLNDMTHRVLNFWNTHAQELGEEWTMAARVVFSISVNSAACERVFSLMKRLYGRHQMRDSTLADNVEASLKLAYNHRVQ